MMNKFCYFILGFLLLNSFANAQEQDSLFIKLKEQQNEKQFYNSIFQNPAFMRDFGKYKLSTLEIAYQQEKNQVYPIQKPQDSNHFLVKASSYFPFNKDITLWGKTSYKNISKKHISWNESIDYPILYPYFTADKKGGDLQQEDYAITGGISKKTKRFNWGVLVDYKAKLASRSKDPRPQNISSNMKLNGGIKIESLFGFDAGVYLGIQRYTQSNEILFFNRTHVVSIYHLHGLGNYNYLLVGNKTDAFYNGLGYSGGIQLIKSEQKKLFFTIDYKELNVEKIIRLSTNIEACMLTNRSMSASIGKLFNTTSKKKYGFKVDYVRNSKIGKESTLTGRSSVYEIISQNKNYFFNNSFIQLSGMFYPSKGNLYISPYINYQIYREKNINPISFQNFDYLNSGLNLNYFHLINKKNLIQLQFDIDYHKTLNKIFLLNDNSEEIGINDMVKYNNLLLVKSYINTNVSIQFNHKVNRVNSFMKLKGKTFFFTDKNNFIFIVSTGINF